MNKKITIPQNVSDNILQLKKKILQLDLEQLLE